MRKVWNRARNWAPVSFAIGVAFIAVVLVGSLFVKGDEHAAGQTSVSPA